MGYDVRQFRPTVYLLILMGMVGYALAAQSITFFIIGIIFVPTSAWLSSTGRFRPLPRPVANLVTLAAVAYVAHEWITQSGPLVMVVGEFLVFLQLVKLWEQRSNRDWAQLLVLSLLLMVAALMNTASLWFGILLAAYLFLSLYCCLLFHLKVEADAAIAALPLTGDKLSPETLRQDQRYLGRSMRRLTGAVALAGISFGVGIFVVFPRGPGGVLGPLQQFHNPLTGFSDHVSFQSVAAITQSHERVAFVKLWQDDKLSIGTQTLLLRGLTLEQYTGPNGHRSGSWDWNHAPRQGAQVATLLPNQVWGVAGPSEEAHLRQQITLWPTNTKVIFAIAGARQFAPQSEITMSYMPEDGSLISGANLKDRLEYEVLSTGTPEPSTVPWTGAPASALRDAFPDIYAYALRPEVCGVGPTGVSLGAIRAGMAAPTSELDARIARNIERYLQTNFSYTLDLTSAESLGDREPLGMFLRTWKRGHCEYFAGAMTLMCQTLGMQARMVIGFKCGPENFNDFTQSYTVYDSDAHAWVEVNTPGGWQTFDPTSSRNAATPTSGFAANMRHLMEYLEFKYANAIIAYDAQSRLNLIASIENAVSTCLDHLLDFFTFLADTSSRTLITCAVLLMLLTAAILGWFLRVRWRLHRRAHRIGIESLPSRQQIHLARQLGFYDDLIRLLEQHKIVRPAHFTPLEFGRSLSFLPSSVYDKVLRLTRIFYQVRYGGVELPAHRQQRLAGVLECLAGELRESIPPAKP